MSTATQRDPRCQRCQDALLLGSDDDAALRHRQGCPSCQAAAAELDQVLGAFDAAARQGLDDLQQARMQSRLMQQLREDQAAASRPTRRLRVLAWAAAAVVLLALGLLLAHQLKPGWLSSDAPVVASDTPRLVPYLLSGPSLVGPAADTGLGQGRELLAVPPGGRLQAALLAGPAAKAEAWSRQLVGRVMLVGPARIRVTPSARRDDVRLVLSGGLLLAQVTPGQARSVHVSAGDVEVTVVGTLFSVEARQDTPVRVAVARGAVEVRVTGKQPIRVGAGRVWTRGASTLTPLDAAHGRLLALHDQGVSPSPPGACGTLVLSGVPARAKAALERVDLGPTPLAVLLPAGSETVSFGAPNHRATRITVQINSGQVTRLGYALNRLDPPVDARLADAQVSAPRPASPRRPPPRPSPRPTPRPTPDAAAVPAPKTALAPDAGPRPPTAEDLYRQAEQALRAGDHGRARSRLAELIRQFPADALTPTAQFELARLAYDARQYDAARRQLDRLLANPRARAHHDPAYFLRCRLMVQRRQNKAARRCLEQFRRRFPASPHDQEALYVLGRLVLATGGCTAARPTLRSYLRRYPKGAFVAKVKQLKASCAPAPR